MVAGRGHRRGGAHGDELVAVDADDDVGHRAGGHEPPGAVGVGRPHGDRGDRPHRRPGRRRRARSGRRGGRRAAPGRSPDRGTRRRRRGRPARHRRRRRPRASPCPARRARPPCPTGRGRSRAARPPGRPTGGHSLAKKPSNSSAIASWSALRPRSTVIGWNPLRSSFGTASSSGRPGRDTGTRSFSTPSSVGVERCAGTLYM